MKMRRAIAGVSALVLAAGLTTACSSGGGDSSSSGADALKGDVTGSITVLTNRTDIVDSVLRKKYAPEFEKLYPGTSVKFEAITNYEQDVTTRLSSGNAGDVALIPAGVGRKQLQQFFVPLGKQADLEKEYRFIPGQSYDGSSYGIPTFGNTIGFVYNKPVWAQAGITSIPTTPTEFLNDLKQVKDKTSATPYYTNYKDQWPLSQFNGDLGVLDNANASNDLNTDKAPWGGDKSYVGVSDGLLFDIVNQGLSEKDPTTTSWESSKAYLATGKISSMFLGSWALVQMQEAAKAAGKSADDIGFMPFPYRVDGKAYATLGPDFYQAVTKSSANKPTADAWITWFSTKSGYAALNGGVGAQKDSENPPQLKEFADQGVNYVEDKPAPDGKENLQTEIVKASQIDLTGGIYRQKLVDVARGAASGDRQSYFDSLNKAWAAGIADAPSSG